MSTTGTIARSQGATGTNRTDVQISKNAWNATLVVGGGATGALMVRDSAKTDGWGLLDAVAVGQVLASAGVGAEPAYTASPALTSATFTTSIAVGSNVAATGAIRLANNVFAIGRNAANNADISLIGLTAADLVSIRSGVVTVSAAAVTSTMPLLLPDGSAAASVIARSADATQGVYFTAGTTSFAYAGTQRWRFDGDAVYLRNDTASFVMGAADDIIVTRLAANILGLRNGTAVQQFKIGPSGNHVNIYADNGTTAQIYNTNATGVVEIGGGNAVSWRFTAAGHLHALGAVDIGNGTGDSPRNIFAEANISSPEFQTTTALVALGGGAAATLGTIGGSGPATAAQNSWLRMVDSTGAAIWVAAWK